MGVRVPGLERGDVPEEQLEEEELDKTAGAIVRAEMSKLRLYTGRLECW